MQHKAYLGGFSFDRRHNHCADYFMEQRSLVKIFINEFSVLFTV